MGRLQGHRPKSLTLLWLWQNHRATLQYDWLNAWHSLYDPQQLPLYAAWPMLQEILKDHTSHTFALLSQWEWIPLNSDVILHALAQANTKKQLKTPWATTGGNQPEPKPKPRDEQAHRQLLERLGITE